ncbi:MAG: FHA domain-containing protein [Gemmatimonadota bacterium]
MILEVVDGRGRVLHRHRLAALPVTVGRAYDCDVILDDPYVDPRHLTIGVDQDAWYAEDNGSANGTWRGGARLERIPIVSGIEIRAGRTTLRFLDPTHPVPAALADRRGGSPASRSFADPTTGLLIVAAAMTAYGLSMFLDSTTSLKPAGVASSIVAMLLIASLWAGAWALATRMAAGRLRFVSHLAWASVFIVAFIAANSAGQWVGFFFPGFRGLSSIQLLLMTGLLTCLLAGHLWLATEMSSRRRWRVAITTSLLALGVVSLFTLTEAATDASDSLSFARVLKPVSAGLVPTSSLDDFLSSTERLRAAVDELAAKAEREEAAAGAKTPEEAGVGQPVHGDVAPQAARR